MGVLIVLTVMVLYAVLKSRGDIMSKTDDLLTAVQALKDEEVVVLQFMTDQAQKLSDALAALAAAQAAGSNDPQIQTAIDGINGVVSDLKAKATPSA